MMAPTNPRWGGPGEVPPDSPGPGGPRASRTAPAIQARTSTRPNRPTRREHVGCSRSSVTHSPREFVPRMWYVGAPGPLPAEVIGFSWHATPDQGPRVAGRADHPANSQPRVAVAAGWPGHTRTVQTFLPYADFERSARTLDPKRLGKQRVETVQVVRALTWPNDGWANHPAVLMWTGYEEALGLYGFTCCQAWTELGFGDTCAATIATDLRAAGVDRVRTQPELAAAGALPPWLGDEAVHRSHQSALVRKDQAYYRALFPGVPDDLPYHWPVRSPAVIEAELRRVANAARRQQRALERARLEAERLRRRRSRAAKKAWKTRRQNAARPVPDQSDGDSAGRA